MLNFIFESTASSSSDNFAGSYTFPASLTLSGDQALEDLLTDVPIFSVGLLSFGVFTFFFAMRRVNALSVVLYATVFFAFIASIFDLSQIVTRTHHDKGKGKIVNTSTGLIVVREILFAISVGLRFFFFWLFVAEPPRGEIVEPTPFDPIASLYSKARHSGAWGRWGIIGIILKWALLAVTIVIGVLQIIWRIVPSDNRLGPVYGAEAAMEIVSSALFVVKLLLNTLITPVTPRSKAFQMYAAVIFALLINLGLGIGNVVVFAFTESTLGRFLLAVELYIIIVFVLISTFYNYIPRPVNAKPKPAFEGVLEIKRSSTFRVPQPANNPVLVMDDAAVFPIDASYQNHPYNDERPPRPSRSSTASRLSSWIVSRRMSRRRSVGSGDRAQLWNQNEAERGESPDDKIVIDGRESPENSPMEQSKEPQNWNDPMATTTMNEPPRNTRLQSTTDSIRDSSFTNNASTYDSGPAAQKPPRMPRFDSTAYSIGSYYGDEPGKTGQSSPTVAATVRQTESPVYGLSGIVRRTNQGRQTPARRSTVVSFSELLRQQTELDNSIAALRLLSPQEQSTSTIIIEGGSKDLNRSNSDVGMPSSMRSEFSLSNFPEPPMTFTSTANGIPSPTLPLKVRSDKNREPQSMLTDGASGLPLPKISILDDYPITPQSLPDSPGRNSGDTGDMSGNMSRIKVNSGGTQYDVTSFIGNLTTPGFKKGPAFDKLADIESEDGVSEFNGGENTPKATVVVPVPNPPTNTSTPRPTYVDAGSALTPATSSRAATTSNGALTSVAQAVEKPILVALPPQAMRSAPGPQVNASNRPPHQRKISPNIFPSLSINNSSDSQSNAAPYLSKGGTAIGPAEEVAANGRRRVPPAGGLPPRPRLAISGPKAPPQDGKSDQAPSAFERPRPPPLILQQSNGKSPGIGGST